ncbi:MAG: tetratricopeptide repeat protein [Verrucomicrobiota bacterium]
MKLPKLCLFFVFSLSPIPALADSYIASLTHLAEHGDIAAQVSLAKLYTGQLRVGGINLPNDPNLATLWYTKAAEQGHIQSQVSLARLYMNGEAKDEKKAMEWYQKAAAAGEPDAIFQLGLGLLRGIGGLTKDPKKGVQYLEKASELSYSEASCWLGNCYGDKNNYMYKPNGEKLKQLEANGYGLKEDKKKALDWYNKGASQGDDMAACALGFAYSRGELTAKDLVKAHVWSTLGTSVGRLGKENNVHFDFEKEMRPEQLQEAKQLLDVYLPRFKSAKDANNRRRSEVNEMIVQKDKQLEESTNRK